MSHLVSALWLSHVHLSNPTQPSRPVPSSGKPSWVTQLKVWAPLSECPALLLSHKPRAQSVGVGHPSTGFPITECPPTPPLYVVLGFLTPEPGTPRLPSLLPRTCPCPVLGDETRGSLSLLEEAPPRPTPAPSLLAPCPGIKSPALGVWVGRWQLPEVSKLLIPGVALRLKLAPFLWPLIRAILGSYRAFSVLRPVDICEAWLSPASLWRGALGDKRPRPCALLGALCRHSRAPSLGPSSSATPLPWPSSGAINNYVRVILSTDRAA